MPLSSEYFTVIEQKIKLQSGGKNYRLPGELIFFEDSTQIGTGFLSNDNNPDPNYIGYGWIFGDWTNNEEHGIPGTGYWNSATADYWAVTRIVLTPTGGELFVKPDDAEKGWFSNEFYKVASKQWSHSSIEKVRFSQPWDSVNYLNYFNVYTKSNKGDLNGDLTVDFADAILAMQVISGISLSETVHKESDVNADGKIGMAEVIFILQKLAGFRDTSLTNVASGSRGAVATASSYGTYMGISQFPARINDEDEITTWAGTSIPAWCKVTFSKPYTIQKIRISTRYHTQQYDVDLSSDGTVWNKVVNSQNTPNLLPSGEDEGLYTLEFDITSQTAKYIRITVKTTDAPAGHIYQAIVAEMQAFAEVAEGE